MLNWLERTPIQLWLQSLLKQGHRPVLHINGVLGVGKTSEVRHALGEFNKHSPCSVEWHTFVKSLDTSAVLGFDGASLEFALEAKLKTWKDRNSAEFRFVVWDDLHLLKPSACYSLIQFLRSHPIPSVQHLLISEEDLSYQLGLDTPSYTLSGISDVEVEDWFRKSGMSPPNAAQIRASHGNLLLLNLSQRNDSSVLSVNRWLQGLSQEALQVLRMLALVPTGISAELLAKMQIDSRTLEELQRRHFATEQHLRWTLLPLPTTLSQELGDQSLQPEAIPIEWLSAIVQSESARLTRTRLHLLLSWHAQHKQMPLPSPEFIWAEPQDLENLHVDSLKNDLSLLQKYSFDREDHGADQARRLTLAALIYSGARQEAVEWILQQKLDKHLDRMRVSQSEVLARFLFEACFYLNRSGHAEKTAVLTTALSQSKIIEISELAQVEIAVRIIDSDPQSALAHLQRLRLKTPKASANQAFHSGNLLSGMNRPQEAQEAYCQAERGYHQIQQPYLASFASFNLACVYWYERDFTHFEEKLQSLKQTVEGYGFRYLEAGVSYLLGAKAFEELRTTEALRHLTNAEMQSRSFRIAKPWQDTAFEKAKVLMLTGMRNQALRLLMEVKESLPKGDTRHLLIELLKDIDSLSSEALLEVWENLPRSHDFFVDRLVLLRGLKSQQDLGWTEAKMTLRDQLVVAELSLAKANREQDSDEFGRCLRRIESLLESQTEPNLERIALLCAKASRKAGLEERVALLDFAEMELDRLPGAGVDRQALQLWIGALRKNSRIETLESWLELPLVVRRRWGAWQYSSSQSQGLYEVRTLKGVFRENARPAPPKLGLSVDEVTGEVHWNGKKIAGFTRKPTLRTLLASLIDSQPESVSKAALSAAIWGEAYSPITHDPRIYTSVQRVRQLLKTEVIENWSRGYRLKPDVGFQLIRPTRRRAGLEDRNQTLLLEALRMRADWIKRAELEEILGATSSTLKRALSSLLEAGAIDRRGAGPNIQYKLKAGS